MARLRKALELYYAQCRNVTNQGLYILLGNYGIRFGSLESAYPNNYDLNENSFETPPVKRADAQCRAGSCRILELNRTTNFDNVRNNLELQSFATPKYLEGIFMKNITKLLATVAFLATVTSAVAQTQQSDQQSRQQDRINSIFGALFGDRSNSSGSLESQWATGRTPLANQRTQFDSRIDSDVRSGALDQRTAARLKTDYAELVQLELRYGADRRFTTQERSELANRYNTLTQVLTNQTYGDDDDIQSANVADGQSEFMARVDASIAARRISRVAGNRLKADYTLLVQTESNYLRDGVLDERERDDIDARLDSLDARVGDTAYTGNNSSITPRARLAAIATAISSSNLTAAAQAQLRVEHSDLSYLEAAYARLATSADERRYLETRLNDLERKLQIRMR